MAIGRYRWIFCNFLPLQCDGCFGWTRHRGRAAERVGCGGVGCSEILAVFLLLHSCLDLINIVEFTFL